MSALQIYGIQKIYDMGGKLKFIGCDPYTQYAIMMETTDDAHDAFNEQFLGAPEVLLSNKMQDIYSSKKKEKTDAAAQLMRVYRTNLSKAEQFKVENNGFQSKKEQEKLF